MGECSYEKLEKTYGGFVNPTYKLYVQGAVLAENLVIKELTAELTAETSETGCLVIKLETGRIHQHLSGGEIGIKDFPLMGKIKVEMGYDYIYKPVFEGIIFEREFQGDGLSDGIITVICLDKKALFRLGSDYKNYALVKSLAAVVQEIASKYDLNLHIDNVPQFEKPVTFLRHGMTDFDYLAETALELGYEFFIINEDFYFIDPSAAANVLLTLEPEHVIKITHRTSMANIYSSLNVYAHNQDKAEGKTEKISAVDSKIGKGKTGAEILGANNYECVKTESVYTNNRTAENVKKFAELRFRKNSMNLTELTVHINGLPEMTPGNLIEISGFTSELNSFYYITGVRHTINAAGFRTVLTCRSNTCESG